MGRSQIEYDAAPLVVVRTSRGPLYLVDSEAELFMVRGPIAVDLSWVTMRKRARMLRWYNIPPEEAMNIVKDWAADAVKNWESKSK